MPSFVKEYIPGIGEVIRPATTYEEGKIQAAADGFRSDEQVAERIWEESGMRQVTGFYFSQTLHIFQ